MLFNLLFELSSEDRYSLLLHLQKHPQRLSNLARELKFSRQEASRNLARLSRAQLVHREVDGVFHLTSYGEQVLKFLPGFNFLSQYTDYFTTHTLSYLPREFFYRIGDLVNCPYIDDALLTFDDCERLFNQAQEQIWFITHQHAVSMLPYMQHALQRGVQIRVIVPTDFPTPPGYLEHDFVQSFLKVSQAAIQSGLYQVRQLDRLDICLSVADPIQGRIVFPTLDRDVDYKGFKVIDNTSHRFCQDLFLYYWNHAQPQF